MALPITSPMRCLASAAAWLNLLCKSFIIAFSMLSRLSSKLPSSAATCGHGWIGGAKLISRLGVMSCSLCCTAGLEQKERLPKVLRQAQINHFGGLTTLQPMPAPATRNMQRNVDPSSSPALLYLEALLLFRGLSSKSQCKMKLSTKGCTMQCARRASSLWQNAAIEIAWLAGSWPAVHCANN